MAPIDEQQRRARLLGAAWTMPCSDHRDQPVLTCEEVAGLRLIIERFLVL